MSNISRRDFLKTAGVMTLAVAAAGVLAGCEGNTAPAPEAGKPEVKPASVSYTDLNGNKLTVESLGRFNIYATVDAKTTGAEQTVLKVTYNKASYATQSLITEVKIFTVGDQELTAKALTDMETPTAPATAIVATQLQDKFKLTGKNVTKDIAADVLGAANIETVRYVVLDVRDYKTNDLKIKVTYTGEDGEGAPLTLPLSVTMTEIR